MKLMLQVAGGILIAAAPCAAADGEVGKIKNLSIGMSLDEAKAAVQADGAKAALRCMSGKDGTACTVPYSLGGVAVALTLNFVQVGSMSQLAEIEAMGKLSDSEKLVDALLLKFGAPLSNINTPDAGASSVGVRHHNISIWLGENAAMNLTIPYSRIDDFCLSVSSTDPALNLEKRREMEAAEHAKDI